MGARAVGGTVAKVALGVAAGVALMLLLDGRRGTNGRGVETAARAHENSGHARAPADDPARLEPASASSPALHKGDDVAAVVERDPDAKPIDPIDDELARLRTQVAELEAEVARLRAQLADGSARRHALHRQIAANELRHGKLYEELVGVLVDDPESVAEDPRRTFDLILRLVDETGLASAKLVEGRREIQPEPEAPETYLALQHSECEWDDRDGDEGPLVHINSDQLAFRAILRLPKVPEGWLGQPLAVDVDLVVTCSTFGDADLHLECNSDIHNATKAIEWNLGVNRHEATLRRAPIRGDEEWRCVAPADLAKERSWLDRLFQQLMTRAR